MNETVRAPRCSLKWKNSTSRITLDMLVDSSDDSLKNAKQNRCHPQRPHLKSRAVSNPELCTPDPRRPKTSLPPGGALLRLAVAAVLQAGSPVRSRWQLFSLCSGVVSCDQEKL